MNGRETINGSEAEIGFQPMHLTCGIFTLSEGCLLLVGSFSSDLKFSVSWSSKPHRHNGVADYSRGQQG